MLRPIIAGAHLAFSAHRMIVYRRRFQKRSIQMRAHTDPSPWPDPDPDPSPMPDPRPDPVPYRGDRPVRIIDLPPNTPTPGIPVEHI